MAPEPKGGSKEEMMTSNAHAEHISFCDEPNIFWFDERDGDHYTENGVVDNDCGRTKRRNDTIERIREKHTADKKVGTTHYEKLEQYTYKSKEAYKQFLREIEEKGLDLKLECKNKFEDQLDYLFIDDQKVGRDPATKEDLDNYYSFKDLNKCEREEASD